MLTKWLSFIPKLIGWLWIPIAKNGAFFVFMFVLGWICSVVELPLGVAKPAPYELWPLELFLDLYLVCLLLMLFPGKLRIAVKALLYILLYGVAVVDMYCYVRFESMLTPTMLMLVGETNSREAGEFLTSYISWDVVYSPVGYILVLMAVHLLWTILRAQFRSVRRNDGRRHHQPLLLPMLNPALTALLKTAGRCLLGMTVGWLVYWSWTECQTNKEAVHTLMTRQTIGEVEHQLTQKPKAELYLPVYRLVFSLYANRLTDHQLDRLLMVKDRIQVDSCSYRVPNIVLIIGESYNKHHSQLYGYTMPTTPRQLALRRRLARTFQRRGGSVESDELRVQECHVPSCCRR